MELKTFLNVFGSILDYGFGKLFPKLDENTFVRNLHLRCNIFIHGNFESRLSIDIILLLNLSNSKILFSLASYNSLPTSE